MSCAHVEVHSKAYDSGLIVCVLMLIWFCSSRGLAQHCTCHCRYSKHDGQLVKKLQQLLDGVVEYFTWAAKHPPADADLLRALLGPFLAFVDKIACYFSGSGVPDKIISGILKVVKGFTAEQRERAAAAHSWCAASMANSAKLWATAKPALRTALASAGAATAAAATTRDNGAQAAPDDGSRRKRVRR